MIKCLFLYRIRIFHNRQFKWSEIETEYEDRDWVVKGCTKFLMNFRGVFLTSKFILSYFLTYKLLSFQEEHLLTFEQKFWRKKSNLENYVITKKNGVGYMMNHNE